MYKYFTKIESYTTLQLIHAAQKEQTTRGVQQ